MEYRLTDANKDKKRYIELFNMYCEELAKDDPTIHQYDPTELANENLEKASDRPMFIKIDGKIAGFSVFMDETEPVGDDACHTYIGEFFVFPEYRNHGIATQVACDYLDSLEYDSGLCYIRGSDSGKFRIRLLDKKATDTIFSKRMK